ncbi:hypothetical protein LBMAG51_10110 [Phycisphaerae bacterium]|nr:hypothetical protein LBMAG51_10110 [Phycisphaerae bacterium]
MISFKQICKLQINTVLRAGAVISCIACAGCDKMCCQDSAQDSTGNATKAVTPISSASTTLYLDVQGMHCDGCVKAIDAEARSIDGVSDAQVSLEKHSAQIQISNPELAAKVESAIRSLGYSVTVVPAPK